MSVTSLGTIADLPVPFADRGYALSSLLSCGPDEAARLARMGYISSYRAGDIIATSKSGMPFYAIVQCGAARSCFITPSGRRYTTGLTLRGQIIPPVRQPVDHALRTVEATLNTTLYSFPAERIDQLLRKDGRAASAFRKLLAQAIDNSGNWVTLLGRKTVGEKIAAFLLLLAESMSNGAEQDGLVEIPLSRSQIAEFLGITIESVSRGLSSLKQEGIIRFWDMRNIEVLRPRYLAELAGDTAPAS